MRAAWKVPLAVISAGCLLVPAAAVSAQTGKGGPRESRAGKLACGPGFGGPRVVHGEIKVATKDGFETLTLDAGKVTSVDASAKKITIERRDDESVTATGTDSTRVCRDGKRAGFSDIKVGDRAQLTQVNQDGSLVLRTVRSGNPEARKRSSAERKIPERRTRQGG